MNFRNRIERKTDGWLQRPGKYLITDQAMHRFGTRVIMGTAKQYNRWRYAREAALHTAAYRESAALLDENGPSGPTQIDLKDGFALDTSQTLPHLDKLLEQSEALVQERGGRTFSGVQQPFLRNLWFGGKDLQKYPAVLDFITSSGVLGPVIRYLKTVPILAKTRPGGIRFMESNAALDPGADGPFRESQLYHLDIHDSPLVYVLVAVRDITLESGPWTFLPDSVSAKATQAMNYGKRGMSYRVRDEEMYRHVAAEERITFACPRGSVLFIDSSRCFHYGSRNARPPRFQLMYAFTSVCRTDFSMTFIDPMPFPLNESDSRLRRLVLG